MYPKGTIYSSGDPVSGETHLHPTILGKIFYHSMRTLGASLMSLAIIWSLFTFGPLLKQEIAFRTNSLSSQQTTLQETQADSALPGFHVEIPSIGASAPIIPNVNPANKDDYLSALKDGVAHAKGTFFPGQGRNVYLFSHSTDSSINFARYNAVFYLLGKLKTGDEIIIHFGGKRYTYLVEEVKTVSAGDTTYLAPRNEETLTLQTCYPPGTTLNRLVIIAKPL